MFFLHKHIAPIPARMMTWEVTTAFDGTLTETELQNRFDEEFHDAIDGAQVGNRVNFWPLVSFNASDGRRHRYLVAVADESLAGYRKKFDRCLPRQVALFAIADKIMRGEKVNSVGCKSHGVDGGGCSEAASQNEGNLLFAALWNETLYMLVFVKGRLCHWFEEHGYGDSFDGACRERVALFKSFLTSDELFENAGTFDDVLVCCNQMANMDNLFCLAAHDPFWRCLDLDRCNGMKLCVKRRLVWNFAGAFTLCLVLLEIFVHPVEKLNFWNDGKQIKNLNLVAPVELDLPSARDLDMLAWAEGHRDMPLAKWNRAHGGVLGTFLNAKRGTTQGKCRSSEFSLLGIAGGRIALVMTAAGESKMLSLGDTLYSYRVQKIGRNDVVFRCGGKEVRYEVGAR